MIDGKKVIALIPARAGSKRLPGKNILSLAGKPLLAWTIEAAKKSKYIDDVIVSTDDQATLLVAQEFGACCPELRPKHLSTDEATTQSVLFHVINRFGSDSQVVILLQPTSPLRNEKHIDEALELFNEKEAYSIVSLTPCEHPPEWSNVLPENKSLKGFLKNNGGKRSQEIETSYRLNGAIYIYDIERLLSTNSMEFEKDTYAYIMPNEVSLDIDYKLDFDICEYLIRLL